MQSKLLNGKKMIKYVILGIIVIAAAVAVVFLLNKNTPTGGDGDDEFNYPDIDTNSVDFDYIKISETGMSALIDVLRVEKRDNGVYIAHL